MSKRDAKKSDSTVEVSKFYSVLKSEIEACKRNSDETIKSAFDTKETQKFYDVSITSASVDAFALLSIAYSIIMSFEKMSLQLVTRTQYNAVKRFCFESAHKFVTASVRVYREQNVDSEALQKAIDADEKAQKDAEKKREKRALLEAKQEQALAIQNAKQTQTQTQK